MAKTADKKAGENYYQALHEFGYDEEHPLLDRGEVIELGGHINDQRLVDMRYLAPVKPGTVLAECGHCGRLFISQHHRELHGDIWHVQECAACGEAIPQKNKAEFIRKHRARCDSIRASRQAERAQHVKQVAELATAGV